MQHIHLHECISTQSVLKDNFTDLSQPILVSTDHQTLGFGRKGSRWSHFEHALAFSFTLSLNEILTLTPLEIGCLLADLFNPNLKLKWPNDLLNNSNEKVGGILCQLAGKNLLVGIGLNLYRDNQEGFEYPVGGIFETLPHFKENYKESLPFEIFEYISKNRLTSEQVRESFQKKCGHLRAAVKIIDGNNFTSGRFVGISTQGEALLESEEGKVQKVLTGSLRYL